MASNDVPQQSRTIWIAGWLIVFVVGGVQVLATRFDMNPDGISYLNLSDLYARGNWSGAVNGYWSPLYPWLLAMTVRFVAPSAYWEAPVVHLVNFIIYLATFGSFLFFLRQLAAFQRERQSRLPRNVSLITFSKPTEVLAAFSLFLWSAIVLVGLANVTPDMLLAGIIYGVAGVMLRQRLGNRQPAMFVLLGALLGVAYLTKAVMFPIGLVVALTCALGLGGFYFVAERTVLVLVAFLAVASPQVYSVSRLTQRLTYGESGNISYATLVNKYPVWWIGEPAGSGIPKHPVRQLNQDPAAYEFPVDEASFSYPFWDEPAYWAEGMRPHFSLREQWTTTKAILYRYATFLGSLMFAFTFLLLSRLKGAPKHFLFLILPSLGAFLLYSLVLGETRYLGAWTVVLFLAGISALVFRTREMRAVFAVLATLALFKGVTVADQTIYPVHQTLRDLSGHGPQHDQFRIASRLSSIGLRPGSTIASIGRSFDGYWARLARVQIAMEIPEAEAQKYWSASDSAKATIRGQFAGHGAEAIVTNRAPAVGPGPEWTSLGGDHFVVLIRANENPHPVTGLPRSLRP
jgi:hypothetical protein